MFLLSFPPLNSITSNYFSMPTTQNSSMRPQIYANAFDMIAKRLERVISRKAVAISDNFGLKR